VPLFKGFPNQFSLINGLKAETQDATNHCDTSPRQVAATNRLVWHVKIIVAATEFCPCDLSRQVKLVWIPVTHRSDKISASSLVAPCVRICNKSLRQNLNQQMRKHQLLSRHVKFELVYISSLPKLITCTEQTCRHNVSQRLVASCVSALSTQENQRTHKKSLGATWEPTTNSTHV